MFCAEETYEMHECMQSNSATKPGKFRYAVLEKLNFNALCSVLAKLPGSFHNFLNFSWNLLTKFKLLCHFFYRIVHRSQLVVTVCDSPQACKNKLLTKQ